MTVLLHRRWLCTTEHPPAPRRNRLAQCPTPGCAVALLPFWAAEQGCLFYFAHECETKKEQRGAVKCHQAELVVHRAHGLSQLALANVALEQLQRLTVSRG